MEIKCHAEARMNQRGITRAMVEDMLNWGDFVQVGGGISSLTIDKKVAKEMSDAGYCVADIDRLRQMAVLVDDGENVVTCLKMRRRRHGNLAAKRYRRKINA